MRRPCQASRCLSAGVCTGLRSFGLLSRFRQQLMCRHRGTQSGGISHISRSSQVPTSPMRSGQGCGQPSLTWSTDLVRKQL
jgi:hypothetical protein